MRQVRLLGQALRRLDTREELSVWHESWSNPTAGDILALMSDWRGEYNWIASILPSSFLSDSHGPSTIPIRGWRGSIARRERGVGSV